MSRKLSLEEKRKLFLLLTEKKSRGGDTPVLDFFQSVSSDWGIDENGYFIRDDGAHYEASPVQGAFINSTARFSAFYSPRGGGKALSIETPVLTLTRGWITMKEVEPGDQVFDESGNPSLVTKVSSIMYGHKCYMVRFSDESGIIADAEHLWDVQNKEERNSDVKRHSKIRTTEELSTHLTCGAKKESNYSIHTCKPLKFPDVILPIHPYILGAWLGDGKSAGSSFYCNDEEILQNLFSCGINYVKSNGKDKYEYHLYFSSSDNIRDKITGRMKSVSSNFVNKLKKLTVLGNKHIPEIYKYASISQRLELLCGLMDTDGYCDDRGHCEFTTVSIGMFNDVLDLVISLGIKAGTSVSRATINGKDCGEKYRIYINTTLPIFKLTRKLHRLQNGKKQANRHEQRFIEDVFEVPSVPVKCIAVNSPNNLYLAGRNLIATHNTGAGAQKALRKIMQGESGSVMNPDLENFKFSTWPEFKRWIPWNMVVPRQRYRQSAAWDATRPFTMVFVNGAKAYCKGLRDPDSGRGPNMNWVWYDEAGRDKTGMGWKLAIAGVRIGDTPQAWATYTPKDFYHWSYDFFIKQTISESMKDIMKTMPEGYKLIDWYHGTRDDNKAHLDPMFYASLDSAYPGGWLRTQEVDGDYANEGGALGTSAWFKDHFLDVSPEWVDKKVRFWDLAATEKKIGKAEPDKTVGTLFSCDAPAEKFCIEHQASGWWVWDKIKENIRAVARRDGTEIPIYIEQEPASGGKNQVAELANWLKPEGFTVRPHNPKEDGDRVMAANTWYAEAAEGKYWIIKGLWNEEFFKQLNSFPDAPHDDSVTSVSGARHSIAPIRKWRKVVFSAVGLNKASIDNSTDKK